MSQAATNGAIALAVLFAFFFLSVLGWRHPQSFGTRAIIGIIIGAISVGALIYVSDSVIAFVEESGLRQPITAAKK